ncbi:hypothetical protein OS965_38665, partial [Streptomyces sp. H27-G5]|uniref:hypothetical protein n=1 Tax=Streptomyces sp. H27-G5 TaxID=2996698 RepID=UPI002271CDCC
MVPAVAGPGLLVMRADSAFYGADVINACRAPLPRRRDQRGPLGAQARHLDQPPRLFLDDIEAVDTEVLHDPLG